MTLSYSPPAVPDHRQAAPRIGQGHAPCELRTSVNFVNFGAAR